MRFIYLNETIFNEWFKITGQQGLVSYEDRNIYSAKEFGIEFMNKVLIPNNKFKILDRNKYLVFLLVCL